MDMDLLWTGASSNVSAVTQYQTIYLCTSPGCRWCPTVQNNIRKLSQLHLSSVRLKYSTTVRQLATFSLNNMSSVRWWPSLFTMNYIYSLLCRQNCRVKCNETRFHSAAISLSWPSSRWSSSSSASRRPPANSRMGHAASYYKSMKYFLIYQIFLRRRDEWENRVHKTNASIKLQWKLCFECWVRTRTISKHKQRPQTSGKPRYILLHVSP